MNILVLNGHKFYPFAQGKLNRTLFNEIIAILSVNNPIKTTVVEEGYNLDEEVEKFEFTGMVFFMGLLNNMVMGA